MGHRGESGAAPENTLAAIRLAADNGITWVELDGNISSDGIAYLHHDDTLERCTNGKGYLIQRSSEELDALDAGAWFSSTFINEPLPRLSAVIDLMIERRMGLNLEIKPTAGWEKPTTIAICKLLKDQWPTELPLILSSFSTAALNYAAEEWPESVRGLIVCAIPGNWREQMKELGCQTFHCAGELLNESQANEIKQAGYGLMCWTVNSSDSAKRLHAWGVDTVISDNPSALKPVT